MLFGYINKMIYIVEYWNIFESHHLLIYSCEYLMHVLSTIFQLYLISLHSHFYIIKIS